MASSFTPNKNIEQPANGDDVGTWNVPVNNDWSIIDTALGGVSNFNVTGASGTTVLTTTQYQPLIFNFTGVLTANVTYQIPSGVGGQWIANNNTTGTFTLTISSGGGGLSSAIPQGQIETVYSDGTNIQPTNTTASVLNGTITNAKLAPAPNLTIKSNISGASASPSDNTFSALLDAILTTTQGSIIYRNASGWTTLAPGAAGQFLQTAGASANPLWGGSWPPGAMNGLALSAASTTSIGIAAGSCRNENAGTAVNMTLASAITKTLSAFAAGSGNGGLFNGSIAASTWYHVYVIQNNSTGVFDAGFETNYPPLNIPAGYTAYRRLGAFKTNGSSQVTPFSQVGNQFYWSTAVSDFSSSVGSTASQLVTLSVPPSVNVTADIEVMATTSSSTNITYISSPLQSDELPVSDGVTEPGYTVASGAFVSSRIPSRLTIMTNTSGQVRFRNGSTITTTIGIFTYGWIDTRGTV